MELGKMKRITDLRTVWPHEANDFTKWLAKDANLGFFLVEIELWQINDSLIAPKFNVVEKPNDWAKTMKSIDGLSETKRLKLEFWQTFNDKASSCPDFIREFSLRKSQAHHWYDLSLGTSAYYICLTANTQKKKVCGNGVELRNASKASRILTYKTFDVKDHTKWDEAIDWLMEMSLKFKQVAKNIQ